MSEENNNVRKRNLKVTYGEYNETSRCLIPLLRLRGKYLIRHGFSVGTKISVVVSDGEISIKKLAEKTP